MLTQEEITDALHLHGCKLNDLGTFLNNVQKVALDTAAAVDRIADRLVLLEKNWE